jgi:hypothetical protein
LGLHVVTYNKERHINPSNETEKGFVVGRRKRRRRKKIS